MHLILAALLGLAARDEVKAGAEYVRGIGLLREQKHEEAARAFEAAITQQAVESPVLTYRDEEGRHRHGYYPWLLLARTRMALAETEASLDVKRDRLQLAIQNLKNSRLEVARTLEVRAGEMLVETNKAIEKREMETPPPEINALKVKIQSLCAQEKFEEAFRELKAQDAIFKGFHLAQKDVIRNSITEARIPVLKRYDDGMSTRLVATSRTDPILDADGIPPFLKQVIVPPEVVAAPAANQQWLQAFVALYESKIEDVRNAPTLDPDAILKDAAEFEQMGQKALEIGIFGGYRVARHFAFSLRSARYRAHVQGAENDEDRAGAADFVPVAVKIFDSAEASRTAAEADLKGRLEAAKGTPLEKDLQTFIDVDLARQRKNMDGERKKREEHSTKYERRVAAAAQVSKSQETLVDRKVMTAPDECRKVETEINQLTALAHFPQLPQPIQASAFYTRAVCVATAAFLDGETPAQVAGRCTNDVRAARSLHADVAKPWEGRLSPRIRAVFEQIR